VKATLELKKKISKFFMSQIFFSYHREDLNRVKPIIEALELLGWTVFWDQTIPVGLTWREVVGNALDQAQCILVAWSETSIKSKWVQEEADLGLERGMLIPIFIDKVRPPIGFRAIQAVNLTQWTSSEPSNEFNKLVNAIRDFTGPALHDADQKQKTYEHKAMGEDATEKHEINKDTYMQLSNSINKKNIMGVNLDYMNVCAQAS
jgi:hypothetical protein